MVHSQSLSLSISISGLLCMCHLSEVKVQYGVHVGGKGGQQGVVRPVGTHLGQNDGPEGSRQQQRQQRYRPAMRTSLGIAKRGK